MRIIPVSKVYASLFDEEELTLLDQFLNISTNEQYIVTRMYFRKRIWYKKEHLNQYEDGFENKEPPDLMKFIHDSSLFDHPHNVLLDPNRLVNFITNLTISEIDDLETQVNVVLNGKRLSQNLKHNAESSYEK